MKKIKLLVSFCLLSVFAFSQLDYAFNKHDFGEIDRESIRWVDVHVKNTGKTDVSILRIETPRSVKFLLSSQTIKKDSIEYIRLAIQPFKKGSFNETVNVWTSDSKEPKTIKLKAEIKETNTLALQTCPSFGDVNPYTIAFDVTVQVVDGNRNPLRNMEIGLFKGSQIKLTDETDNKGLTLFKGTEVGLYRVLVTQNGVKLKDELVYFNRRNNTKLFTIEEVATEAVASSNTENAQQTIPFKKTEPTSKATVQDAIIPEKSESELEKSNRLVDDAITKELLKDDSIEVSTNFIDDAIERELKAMEEQTAQQEEDELIPASSQEELTNQDVNNDPEDFSRVEYAPNNVVFLVDVSTSMRYLERIDLLKVAMINLSDKWRDIDYLAMVTYASKAKLVLPSANGTEKEKIDSLIWNLEARGTTASDKGLDQAYEVAEKAFIKGGNNQIILITDGAFDAKALQRLIKKKAKEGINLSVVGIKTEKNIGAQLANLAKIGNGTYVNVTDLHLASTVLVSEIKKNSKKH